MFRIRFAAASAGAALLVPVLLATAPASAQGQPQARAVATLGIPTSVETRHRQLQMRLSAIASASGRTGAAARDLQALLRPHFIREEQLVLPLLGLLPALATGGRPADPDSVVAMADLARAEMPKLLRGHQEMSVVLARMRMTAQEEGNTEAAAFADQLFAYATEAEQVFYPSALLVGDYLRNRR